MPLSKPNWRVVCIPMLALYAAWPVDVAALTEPGAAATGMPTRPTDDTAYAATLGALIRANLVFTSPASLPESAEARLALLVDAHGKIVEASVRQSSGSEIFDAAMIAAVRKSLPFPPPPEHRVRWVNLTFHPGGASASAAASAPAALPEIVIAPAPSPKRDDVTRGIFRQKGVGQLDADGWTVARSTDGHFMLSVPGRFSDRTLWFAHPGPQAPRSAETLLAHGGIDTLLVASRLQYGAPEIATRCFESLEADYRTLDARAVRGTFLGYPSIDSRVVDPKKSEFAVERIVLVGADILWVRVTGPMTLRDAVERDASRIVGSLRIDAAATNLGSPPEDAFALPN
ncbi:MULTISPECIES: energy transducer TonB [Burkholderia]|nr:MULTISPECIES: energy transducer TonB [Burkholderia]